MNSFKSGKSLFGISKYGSSGLYVDLLTDQSINGIKRFLSNLITNSNVNFNTSANIGRIVFRPNEIVGFGGDIVAIFTKDENDGAGWFFDSYGFLYYLGSGLIPQKISFNPVGNINAIGTISGGSLSAGTGTISTTGAITGGSLSAGTGTISTTGAITGGSGSFTTGNFTSNVNITGATNGLTISGGFSGLFCNKIESQSGGAIVSSAVFNLRSALAVTNITLDPLNTIRLKINGITGTNSYLFFNNSNILGFFNTSTGTNTYTITDLGVGTFTSLSAGSGSISTSGTITGGTGSFTSLLTNTISPYSGTVINISALSEFNWLKASGVSRARLFPTIASGDIFTLFKTADNVLSDGYWYYNTVGNHGYYASGSVKWELKSTGGLFLNNDLIMNDTNYSIFCNTWYSQSYSTYRNVIRMNTLTSNASVSGMSLFSQYIDFIHPSITPTGASKYFFMKPISDGNLEMYINNISGRAIAIYGTVLGFIFRQITTDYQWIFNALTYTFAGNITSFSINGTNAGNVIMSSPSTVTYANSSDYRLKQDITPLDEALDSLMMLKPVIYRMKHDVEEGYNMYFQGFLAHEVENIIPNIVSGKKDDPKMMQQLDYSKFTPLLTGAVQELNELVKKQQKIIENQTLLIQNIMERLQILENK